MDRIQALLYFMNDSWNIKDVLSYYLVDNKLSVAKLSKATDISVFDIYKIMYGRGVITQEIAEKLGIIFKTDSYIWLQLGMH